MANSKEQMKKKEDMRGKHPNSLKNLEKGQRMAWKEGKSGNPNGHSLTGLVKKLLKEVPELQIGGKRNTKEWRLLIAQAWLVGAYQGNATYFKELLERIEGKVAQPIVGKDNKDFIPEVFSILYPEGTVVKAGRMSGNGHDPVEVDAGGDGHKETDT